MWRVAPQASCRVLRMSGRADPFDALGAEGRRPLAPCWVIRMSALGGPRDGFWLYGGASPPVRLGDPYVGPMGDPLAGLPVHTHTGGIPDTARAKQSNEHQYSGKFILGGFAPTTCPLSTRTVRMPSPLYRARGLLCQWGVACRWTAGGSGGRPWTQIRAHLTPTLAPVWHGMA